MQPKRFYYLDNLRVALTILVIAHHVGQAYGPTGGWWHVQEQERAAILGPFFTVNRSFFMSLFFMISGYFMALSFERSVRGKFVKSRLLRLGAPLLFFALLVIPIQHYIYYLNFRGYGPISFWAYYLEVYFGMGIKPAGWTGPSWPELNFGHLWYLEHLLVFSLVYALIQWFVKKPLLPERFTSKIPYDGTIKMTAFTLAFLSGLVRIWYPVDHWEGFLGFIQVAWADVPRDLGFFIIGIMAYRGDWFERFPTRRGYNWLWVGVILAVLWYLLRLWFWDLFPLRGFALDIFYLIWEHFLCTGMCIGLVVTFREKFNSTNRLGKTLAGAQYGAYLFHVVVVVLLQYLVLGFHLPPLLKFAIVTLLAVPLVFAFSAAIRRIRWVRRII